MKKHEIAQIFDNIADILEIKGENVFRIRAYRQAAQNLLSLSQDLEKMADEDHLQEIPGIGVDLAQKIKEYLKTGRMKFYDQQKKRVPAVVLEMMEIPGIGPKTAVLLQEKLKIKSISDLEKKAKEGKIARLPHLKEKTQENILKAIGFLNKQKERMPLGAAYPIARQIIEKLSLIKPAVQLSPAGSLRRMKDTVRDIDILCASVKAQKVMDEFVKLPQVERVSAKGPTKASVITKDGVQVDLRVVEPSSYGAALLYFTGSKQHNIKLREMALKKGLKINEYGVFDNKTSKKIAGKTEEEVYKTLKMDFVPPEIREDTGEIEAALEHNLPELIRPEDIKGDLHIHTKASDGVNSVAEMVEAAQKKKYEYIAITEHSKSLKVAGGLSEKELLKQAQTIRKLSLKMKNFHILAGTEANIDNDGKLDYPDSILGELDIVIAAIHTGFEQNRENLTRRILKAMENENVDILAHPTGRLIGKRDAYALDMEAVLKQAKDTGTALEINAYPLRLDLADIYARRAKELGVKMAITTDAHNIGHLDNMLFGVALARRGWLEKKDVLNTYSYGQLMENL